MLFEDDVMLVGVGESLEKGNVRLNRGKQERDH